MGRQVKQRRSRQNRQNPIMPQLNAASMGSEKNNASILNKLSSQDHTERAWAATALSQLVLENEAKQILLDSGIAQKLLLMLADPSPLVIIEALGALRNLAIVDDKSCHALLETDILSRLRSLAVIMMNRIESIRSNSQLEVAENELDLEQIFQMAEQIFGLLWPEISGDALALGIELISQLLFFFKKETAAPQVTREVMGQVILLCVEDHQPTAEIFQVMKSVMDDTSEPIGLRVIAASVLAQSGDYLSDILSVFETCLNHDWISWIEQARRVGLMTGENTTDDSVLNEARKATDKRFILLESMGSKLRICQLACESFANILSTDDDEMEVDEVNDIQLRIAETAIKSTNLLPIFLGISETSGPSLDSCEGIDFEWKLLQNRCLGALANLFLLIDGEFIVSCNLNVSDIWNRLYSVHTSSQTSEMIMSVVECLSALTRASPLNSISINFDHISAMINHYVQSQSSDLLVHIIGILGALAQYQGNIEANKMIGDFFMDQVFKSSDSIVIMEILNVIFDIYADKNFDYDEPVFIKGDYLSLLQKLEPVATLNLKREVGGDECLENLRAFIEYKASE